MAMLQDRLLKRAEVLEICNFSAKALYKRIQDSGFPRPKALGASSRWSEVAVREWIACLPDRE